jgi:putative glutamine amidotransferase
MGRPIIGITSELEAARWGDWIREAVVSPVSYTRAVERAGAVPVLLPPVPPGSVRTLVAGLGGLVFTGGRDVDPELYDEQRLDETDAPDYRRDRFELALMRAAIEAGLPFLAIGRGLHVLTVARGGRLTQHLPAHGQNRTRYQPHDVRLSRDCLLGRLLGDKVVVPAAHHQAPGRRGARRRGASVGAPPPPPPAPPRLGAGLTVAGWSPDDEVVEALEVAGHRFGVGVHWHPEEGDDPRLLAALVEAASVSPAAPVSTAPEPEPVREPSKAPKAPKATAGSRSR